MPIGIIKNKANFAPSFVIVFSSVCSIALVCSRVGEVIIEQQKSELIHFSPRLP